MYLRLFYHTHNNCRPRWSRGYHTRHWTRSSRVQIRPGSKDFLQSVKILSMTSSGSEAKRGSRAVDLLHVKEPQAEIRTSEQNVGLFTLTVESDANDLRC